MNKGNTMKKISALALAGMMLASPLMAAIQTVNLSVPGMFCASCPFIVEAAINELDGIESIKTDLDARTALVVFDDELTSVDAIISATTAVGYESTVIELGS